MYIKRGTGCKFRQTLTFFNLIPIYHDYDIQYSIKLINETILFGYLK